MPVKNATLSDSIEEFLQHRKSMGLAKTTARNNQIVLRHLLAFVGNILMRNIKHRHIDNFFLERETKVEAGTLQHEESVIRVFFEWAEDRKLLGPDGNPAKGRAKRKVMPKKRLRIPASEFDRMLDLATHPTDRIVFALGIYLLLRQSEIKGLRVGDVNLVTGYLTVTVFKTTERDEMPISAELDRELRQWLTEYARQIGRPLLPEDYLVPAKTRPAFVKGGQGIQRAMTLRPSVPMNCPHHAVQRILAAAGYGTHHEGVHTLRRSAARAIFDHLVEEGYDGALATTQAMLHHSSVRNTERYIGITLNTKKRDELFRGKQIYAAPADSANVVELRKIGG